MKIPLCGLTSHASSSTFRFTMKKLIVSGFEPFAGLAENPSQKIVSALEEMKLSNSALLKDVDLRTVILPVSFQKSYKVLASVTDEFQPDFILATGLAQRRRTISLERIAINVMTAETPDNDGEKPVEKRISASGPDGVFTNLPLEKMLAVCDVLNIPAEISNAAGTYVCNQVMYEVCLRAKRDGVQAGFIHLPSFEFIPLERQLQALVEFVSLLART